MIFDSVEIHNVRNLKDVALQLRPSVNLITGPNGSGKTTVLESLYLVVRGRSFRPGTLNSLIRFKQNELRVHTLSKRNESVVRLGIEKSRTENVRIRMNGRDIRQISQIVALVPVQTFLSDLPELVFGVPSVRRAWLNWGVFHSNNELVHLHRVFLKTLNQRNRAIQRGFDDLASWTKEFVTSGLKITELRYAHVEALNEVFQQMLSKIAPDLGISLELAQGWSGESLTEILESDRAQEQKYGFTRYGPHRADLRIRVVDKITGNVVGLGARVLSRGQGKAVAGALKLAQVTNLSNRGIPSIVLLDDIASEFDFEHTRRFLQILEQMKCQVIATTVQEYDKIAHRYDLHSVPNVIRIKEGCLLTD